MLKTRILKTFLLLLLINLVIPLNVLAYSDYIIAGGQNIGIELNSDGILIVGTYKIGKNNPAYEADLQTGDKILSINDVSVQSIEEMLNVIDKLDNSSSIKISYLRGS